MRIISGNFRGKKIQAPADLPVRPTTDFAKSALFSMLENQFDLRKVSVLDLYSGTGNLSYEFFSRGTNSITCVDLHPGCTKFIRQTFEKLNAPRTIDFHKGDVCEYLENTGKTFDIIVADPPFEITPAEQLVEIIERRSLLKPDGVFILEHHSSKDYSQLNGYLSTRKYGIVNFTFFKF